jgi:DNA mismatch repair protein MutS2
MDNRAFNTLEFNKIKDMLRGKAASQLGKRLVDELTPSVDIDEIKTLQSETATAVSMIMKKGSLILGGLKDLTDSIKRVNVGGVLSIDELISVGDFLYCARKAKGYSESESKNDDFASLMKYFDELISVPELENDIERCIVDGGEISDDASPALRDIRRNIRSANSGIKEKLNGIIHSTTYKNMLQDAVITIRNDRYCVPVKQEYKNAFSGMVHDQSATGATVFIEPMSVVQLNNKIKELKGAEKKEIDKILARLSERVYENSGIISADMEILAQLDFIFAKAELAVSMKATEPKFNDKGYINIKKARHPLLDSKKVVPTDIYLGRDFTTLLITGPNTGGKTVSLKTIGLFTLMGQSGLHIPAFDNSELTVFEEVFADIGDEQSIEQSLSTFSSHMSNIVRILDKVTNNSLVLLDELGAGTDPTEGAALAIAIIQYLHALGVRTAVTTHYSELKVFALTANGVENASCEFDVETLRPTYRLLIGVPGKSNAFAISQRLGLPDYIINEAKEVLSHEDVRFEDVITELEISKKTVAIEQEKAEQYRREAQKLRQDAEKQKQKLERQREKIMREAQDEARRLVSDAKDEADAIVKEIRKLQRDGAKIDTIDTKRKKLKEKLNSMDTPSAMNSAAHAVPKNLKVGDRVYIHSLAQSGTVTAAPDSSGNVMIKTGIMKVKIGIEDLSLEAAEEKPKPKQQPKKFAASFKNSKARDVRAEVDLRGMMALEAIDKLDKYLDDAYLAGLHQVTIIHGKGTGALRAAVQDYLRTSSHVKSYRQGIYGEGEAGVTIAELK